MNSHTATQGKRSFIKILQSVSSKSAEHIVAFDFASHGFLASHRVIKKHSSSVLQLSDKEMNKKSHIPFSYWTKACPVRALFYPRACKLACPFFYREQLIKSSMPSPILTTSVKLMSRRENKELAKTNLKNMDKTMQKLQHIGSIKDLRPKNW